MVDNIVSGIHPPKDFPPLPSQINPQDPNIVLPNIKQTLYANLLKLQHQAITTPRVLAKPVVMLYGEPNIT